MRRLSFPLIVFFFLLISVTANAGRTLYWVGGAGNWTDIKHWSLSSGNSEGVTAASVPSSEDIVIIDQNSCTPGDTITLNNTAFCKDLRVINNTPVVVSTDQYSVNIQIYGSMQLFKGMKMLSNLFFKSPGSETIYTDGVYIGSEEEDNWSQYSMNFDNPTGIWTLADSLNVGVINLISGTFKTNNQKVVSISFYASDSAPRSVDFSKSLLLLGSLNIQGDNITANTAECTLILSERLQANTGQKFHIIKDDTTSYSNASISADIIADTLIFTQGSVYSGKYDYVEMGGSFRKAEAKVVHLTGYMYASKADSVYITKAWLSGGNEIKNAVIKDVCSIGRHYESNTNINVNTIENLTIAYGADMSFNDNSTLKLTGEIKYTGDICDGYIRMFSPTMSNSIIMASQTVHLDHFYISNIIAQGAQFNVTGYVYNVTGFTVTAPSETQRTLYRIGGAGAWNDPSKWSLSSGGGPANCAPSPIDNVVFDANSAFESYDPNLQNFAFTENIIVCGDIRFEDSVNPPYFRYIGSAIINGSFVSVVGPEHYENWGGAFWAPNFVRFVGSGNHTISSKYGYVSENYIYFDGTGTWTLTDSLINKTRELNFIKGNINTNNQKIVLGRFISNNSNQRSLTLGSSEIILEIAWYPATETWEYLGNNATLDAGTSKIIFDQKEAQQTSSHIFYGMHKYNDIIFKSEIKDTKLNGLYAFSAAKVEFNSVKSEITGVAVVDSLIFNKLGSVNISTGKIGVLTFNDDGKLNRSMLIDEMKVKSSKIYTLAGGTTQTINKFTNSTEGCPGGLIELKAGSGYAEIKSELGALHVENVYMTGIKAPLGNYTAKGIDAGNNSGWVFSTAAGRDFFWIGGQGNWDDPSHWAFSSGGLSGGCVPTNIDNVFFDSESGLSGTDTVFVAGNVVECLNMKWENVQGNPVLSKGSSQVLNLYGSLQLQSGMEYIVKTTFLSWDNVTIHTIKTGGTILNNLEFSRGAGWELLDNLETRGIFTLNTGKFRTNNYNLTAHELTGQYSSLELGSSEVRLLASHGSDSHISGAWTYRGSVNTGNSHIILVNGGGFHGNSYRFPRITANKYQYSTPLSNVKIDKFYSDNYVVFAANCTIQHATIQNSFTMKESVTIDTLLFKSGYNNLFWANKVMTINKLLKNIDPCGGTTNFDYYISWGTGSSTIKAGSSTTKIELENVVINEVNAAPVSGVVYNNTGGILKNSTGWTLIPKTGKTLYWVGGSGNWNDPLHWSENTGGIGGACVPTLVDNAIFDNNSASPAGEIVIDITSDAYCNDLKFLGNSNIFKILYTHDSQVFMHVYADLYLQPGMLFNVKTYLKAKNPACKITTNGYEFNEQSLIFYSETNGGWELQGDLHTKFTCSGHEGLFYYGGNLNLNQKTLYGSITDYIPYYSWFKGTIMPREFNIENSTLIMECFQFTGEVLKATGSRIELKSGWGTFNYNPDYIFDTIIIKPYFNSYDNMQHWNRDFYFENPLTANYLYSATNTFFRGDVNLKEFIMAQDSVNIKTEINAGSTMNISDVFVVSGTPCYRNIITSSDPNWTQAYINIPFTPTVDFIGFNGINASNSKIIAEANSDNMGNNTNIEFISRDGGLIGFGGDKNVCNKGFPYVLNTNGFFPGVEATFEWKKDGLVIGTEPTLTITEPGTYYAKVNYYEGCSYDDIVTVTESLPIEAPISNYVRYICHEDKSEVTVTSPLGAQYKYALQDTAVHTYLNFQSAPNFENINAGAYYLVVSNLESCLSDSVLVEIAQPNRPGVSNDILIADKTACLGSTVTLLPITGIGQNPVLKWYADDALTQPLLSNADGSFTTTVTAPSATYYITISSDTICENLPLTAKPVTIIGENCIVAVNDTVYVLECQSVIVDLLSNDILNGNTISVVVPVTNSQPNKGIIEPVGDKVKYTNTVCNGGTKDVFKYAICNTEGTCYTADVHVFILNQFSIILNDPCSFHPNLELDVQLPEVNTYVWQYYDNNTWINAEGENYSTKYYPTKSGKYRIKFNFRNEDIVIEVDFNIIKKAILPGNIIWYETALI